MVATVPRHTSITRSGCPIAHAGPDFAMDRIPARHRIGRRAWLSLGGVALVALGIGYAGWTQRWAISGRAVAIVDPVVRRWAADEVRRLSGGVYSLTASTIVVDEATRRLSIDTILVITDPSANAQRPVPLPAVTVQFLGCALEGIDLEQLAARRGLHVSSAGCTAVRLTGEVPAPRPGSSPPGSSAGGVFLSLRENLDLPRTIPFIRIDTVSFPAVQLALGITGRNRRRTALALDQFMVRLDSLHYDPRQKPEERGPLLSKDVRFRLDGFTGSREAASRLVFDSLSASLVRGVVQLDGLIYEPIAGSFGDSLGFQALEVGHLDMAGVDWRGFLTAGDVGVSRLTVMDAMLRFPPARSEAARAAERARPAGAPTDRLTVGAILRALGRDMRLDTLQMTTLRLIEQAKVPADSMVTSLGSLEVRGVRFDDSTTWTTAFPVGRITIAAERFARRQRDQQLLVAKFQMNVPAGTASVDSLRYGPDGNDAAFQRRHRYRTDRMILSAGSIAVAGLDLPAFLSRSDILLRRADAAEVELDILTDKRKASAPGRQAPRRFPQQALRELGLVVGADTITVAGEARYREHAPDAARPGVVTFRNLKATLLNLTTDPARQTDSTPFRLVADARLMGAGAFHFELEMPLLSERFAMRYSGRLGAMPVSALNGFASDGAGIRFTRGQIEGIRFNAVVTDGRARGTIVPRWTDLGIELPGLSRKNTGIFGGIKRAAAKFVANAFMVRDDNTAGRKEPPRDGVISHRWNGRESLLQFLWNSLRDPLVPLMKK
jgi:hypothetical protein